MPLFPDNETFKELILTWPDLAIKYLYEHYYDPLVRIAERKTHDRKASEDIVQEAFIEIWKKSKTLCAREGFLIGPYLVYLVKKKSITFYHQSIRRQNKSLLDISNQPGAKVSTDLEILESDKCNSLRGIVLTLPVRQKECLLMRFFEEMSIGSISVKLGISKKAVEKNITNGLKNLRNYRSVMY